MKKLEIFLLSLIIIGAFAVRLYKINTPLADWHSWRQVDTASVTRSFVERGINLLFPRYHDISSIQTGIFNPQGYRFVEFPIYNAIHTLLLKAFPAFSLEVWGRLLSIFCSLISLIMVYLLGKRYIGGWGGILAAFFFAFIPYNIFYSRVILPEPMATMFVMIALVLFSKFVDKGRSGYLYFSAGAFALSLLLKPFTVFFSVPMIYLLIAKHGFKPLFTNSKLLIKLLIFTCITLVPLLLWRYWVSLYPVGVPFFTWAFNGDKIRFRPAFWRWIFGERLGRLILGIWGVVPFSLGVITKNYFVLSFLGGMFLYVATIATANVRHDYYQIFIIPAVCLALAQGADYLLNNKQLAKYVAWGLLGFSVVMMLGLGFYQVKEYYMINHPEIITAGQAVDKLTPKDALVIAPYNGDTAFLYQTKRWGWPVVDTTIDEVITQGADYYVSVNYDDMTNNLMKRFATIDKTPEYVILDLHKEIGR